MIVPPLVLPPNSITTHTTLYFSLTRSKKLLQQKIVSVPFLSNTIVTFYHYILSLTDIILCIVRKRKRNSKSELIFEVRIKT